MASLLRKSEERGRARLDWLDSRHSFSFGDYRDPAHMGFGPLRVINEEYIAPGGGFPTHPHRDMEIVTYVLAGALAHKDSLGTGSTIQAGDVQRMTAGTGIRHSEFNASETEPVHLLQIWILPEHAGLDPAYEQKSFPAAEKRGRLRLVAARDGRDGAVTIRRDVDLHAAILDAGTTVRHALRPQRTAWVQVARGAIRVGTTALAAGDALGITDAGAIEIAGTAPEPEILLFDMAA